MKLNMGVIDRVLRVLIALVIGVLYWQNIISGTLGIVLLVLGGVFVLTSLVGFCPLYLPLKLSTKRETAIQRSMRRFVSSMSPVATPFLAL